MNARQQSIKLHNDVADWFLEQYSLDNPFSSDFLYGRKQINVFFDKYLNQIKKSAKILDVGCGIGAQIHYLNKKGFKAIGIEPSSKMIKLATLKLPRKMIKKGSVFKLPFKSNSLDFVYAIEVFRYLDHKDNLKGLNEIYRVLKQDGIFFGTFVNKYATDGYYVWHKLFNKKKFHCEFETPFSLRSMLEEAGFFYVKMHGTMFAELRFIYKLSISLGILFANILEPFEFINDKSLFQRFSGHLIGVGVK